MANNILQGTRHAEFLAIAEMLQTYPKSAIKETDLYVTVEPCIMCTAALRQYGIRSVFVGTHNERFGGVGGVLTVHSE
jgi:tRNA-specific adenosine deaminase 2